jgi:DNA replication and repair protein RecF
MLLRRLQLINFKNHEEWTADFSRINCITGPNGVGKTNVLDAVHYLSLCKSYFNSIDSHNIRHDEGFFLCAGNYNDNEGEPFSVQLGLKRNTRKSLKKDGVEYEKLAHHVGLIPLVIITPFDIQLVYESSEERRRFTDTLLSQTDAAYLESLQLYNRVLDQRNRQLKQFAERNTFDATLLETYDQQLAPHAEAVYAKRKAFFADFLPLFIDKYTLISGGAERAGVEYESHLHRINFLGLMEENLRRDKVLERTSAGPHKDDLTFTLDGEPVKRYASQGQTKSFVIALKLAQYDYLKNATGKKPLLLLDDIFEKLDAHRATQLMQLVANDGFGQLFITDTHAERVQGVFENLGITPKYFTLGAPQNVPANN